MVQPVWQMKSSNAHGHNAGWSRGDGVAGRIVRRGSTALHALSFYARLKAGFTCQTVEMSAAAGCGDRQP